MSSENDDYWVIEVEIEVEFGDDGYYFTIEDMELLERDFDEWLDSLNDEEVDDEDGDPEEDYHLQDRE